MSYEKSDTSDLPVVTYPMAVFETLDLRDFKAVVGGNVSPACAVSHLVPDPQRLDLALADPLDKEDGGTRPRPLYPGHGLGTTCP